MATLSDDRFMVDRLAWRFHYNRVSHVWDRHETSNGAAGVRCTGPDPQDVAEARAVLGDVLTREAQL